MMKSNPGKNLSRRCEDPIRERSRLPVLCVERRSPTVPTYELTFRPTLVPRGLRSNLRAHVQTHSGAKRSPFQPTSSRPDPLRCQEVSVPTYELMFRPTPVPSSFAARDASRLSPSSPTWRTVHITHLISASWSVHTSHDDEVLYKTTDIIIFLWWSSIHEKTYLCLLEFYTSAVTKGVYHCISPILSLSVGVLV